MFFFKICVPALHMSLFITPQERSRSRSQSAGRPKRPEPWQNVIVLDSLSVMINPSLCSNQLKLQSRVRWRHWTPFCMFIFTLQPSAFRRPSSLSPVCRLQKACVSKCHCVKAGLVQKQCLFKDRACVKTAFSVKGGLV